MVQTNSDFHPVLLHPNPVRKRLAESLDSHGSVSQKSSVQNPFQKSGSLKNWGPVFVVDCFKETSGIMYKSMAVSDIGSCGHEQNTASPTNTPHLGAKQKHCKTIG